MKTSVDEEAKLQVELPVESANASQDEECATDDLTVTVNIQETEKKNHHRRRAGNKS